jgi:hypothetical protein
MYLLLWEDLSGGLCIRELIMILCTWGCVWPYHAFRIASGE